MADFQYLKKASKRHLELKLINSCHHGDKDAIEYLLSRDVDINSTDEDGMTPLIMCVISGHEHLVEFLLHKGADVNYFNPSALSLACLHGRESVVDMLVKRGGRCIGWKVMEDAWFEACKSGWVNIMEVLIRDEVDVKLYNDDGKTGLFYACESGHANAVELLLKSNVEVDSLFYNKETPLMLASGKGDKGIVDVLLKRGCLVDKVDQFGRTALMKACANGHESVVSVLIEAGPGINVRDKDGVTPLMYACVGGSEDVVRLLLEKGADVGGRDEKLRTVIFHACEKASVGIVRLLLDNGGVDLEVKGENDVSALMTACGRGDGADIVKLLVESGADLNVCDWEGDTALAYAVNGGCMEVVDLSKECRVIQSKTSKKLETAFVKACEKSSLDVLKYLTDLGVDVNFSGSSNSNASQNSPLAIACKNGCVEAVAFLLENGADVNTSRCDDSDYTLLMEACKVGNEKLVVLLLDCGADVDVKLEHGQTALTVAFMNGHPDIVKLLLERGACADVEHGVWRRVVLDHVCCKGYGVLLRSMIDLGCDVTQESRGTNDLLWTVCEAGHKDIVRLLVDKGWPSISDRAFRTACKNGYLEVVEAMVNRGVDVNMERDLLLASPFVIAAEHGHLEVVQLLIKSGVDFECFGKSALQVACRERREKVVEFLLEKGAEIDATPYSKTVTTVCENVWMKSLKILLDKDLDEIKDDCGRVYKIPDWIDCKARAIELMDFLLKEGIVEGGEDGESSKSLGRRLVKGFKNLFGGQ